MILIRYKWRTGLIAWMVQRFTGIALTLYLFIHLYILSSIRDPDRFEFITGLMSYPLVKVGELALLAMVAAHAFNGTRVTMLELGVSTRLQKPLFWGGAVCVGVLMIIGGVMFLGGGH